MELQHLLDTYPLIYHMAEEGSWKSIRPKGLLSTTALLDLFEIKGAERKALEREHRPASRTITHPKLGECVVRDQKPMSIGALEKCLLDGLTPADWFLILNRRVFFWATRERLLRLLHGRMYRESMHDVLTVNTQSLVGEYADRIELCAYNSGSTIFNPAPRGNDTFQSIANYPFETWCAKRGRRGAVAEITVPYSVPNIRDHVVRVERMQGAEVVELIWER